MNCRHGNEPTVGVGSGRHGKSEKHIEKPWVVRVSMCDMMTKIHILKKIDKLISRLIYCLPRCSGAQNPRKTDIRRILFIRPGGIGDAVLLIPTILVIKRNYPAAVIDLLAEKRNAAVFCLCPPIQNVFSYESPRELLKALRTDYDIVVDAEQWHRLSAVIARLTRAPWIIGFSTNERERLLTHPVAYSNYDFEADSFCHLVEPLGITVKNEERQFLNVPDASVKKAGILLEKYSEKPFIAIFPGSSIPEKQWGIGNFAKLALELSQAGFPIIVIGGEKERAVGEEMTCGLDALNLAGKTSLVETAAVIVKSTLVVSGDSGVLHIAAGLGKPTVSLFGPSNSKKWAPRGHRHIVINKNLPCSPCSKFGYTPKCPTNARCMADISVAEVVAAVKKLLVENSEEKPD